MRKGRTVGPSPAHGSSNKHLTGGNVVLRKKLAVGVVALAVVVGAAACSTERTKGSSGEKVDTINITASAAQPNFTRNFNAFSPASKKSPGITLFYEPLVRVDHTDSNKVKPWLAKSFKFSDGGRTLTFKLRDDVTWSDGKPLTSADVKYTLELPKNTKGLGAAPPPNLKSVTTPDKHTAVVHYSTPELHDLVNYGVSPRLIVPAHIWKKHNPVKWTNKNPVGTGPYKLANFSPQSMKLDVKDSDYWGGKFNGVEHVNIKAFGSERSGKQMVLKNKVTWSTMSWKNYQDDFVKQDPKHHHYWTYPTGGSEGVLFNMKKAPTNNVHIRRALYAALDSKSLLKLYDTGQDPANPTGLDGDMWSAYMPSKLQKARHKQDATKAKTELNKSGYEVKNGKLTKDGKTYPLSLKTNSDYGNWSAYAPGLKSQWKKVLGLKVSIKKSPTDQLGEYQQEGDFQMLYDFLSGGNDIWSSLNSQLNSKYVEPLGTKATSGNPGRYSNPKVDKLLNDMATTLDQKRLKKDATQIEKIVLDDVPYGPIHSAAWFVEVNTKDWTGFPSPDDGKYVPQSGMEVTSTMTLQHLKPNATKKG